MTEPTKTPELIFGLVGPIGCNIQEVEDALSASLKSVDYTPHTISLSNIAAEIQTLSSETGIKEPETLSEKIVAGNAARQKTGLNDILAMGAVTKIRKIRTENGEEPNDDGSQRILPGHAFILRQLKTKEEVRLLQKVYGDCFIQISIAQPLNDRISSLKTRIRAEDPSLDETQISAQADKLVKIDDAEMNEFGQAVGNIFHLSDFFVNATTTATIKDSVDRFVQALFGNNFISPTKCEMGSYFAKAISMRSNDLSRQVGAAILSSDGDVIAMGCNEVAKPFGGNYWSDDEKPMRDIDQEGETNKVLTNQIIHDFLKALEESGQLKSTREEILSNEDASKAIKSSMISDITEYGRVVHAEMNALSDAARLGRSTAGATIYVTTFPCHNCAKHIIASGISKIVYIEPYPKSKTLLLYEYALSTDQECEENVQVEHFSGVSPKRFDSIFEKGRRRDSRNRVEKYYQGSKRPRVEMLGNNYTVSEALITKNYASKFKL